VGADLVSIGHVLNNSLEGIRSGVVLKALDAIVTAPLRARTSLLSNWKGLLHPRSANYDRVASFVGFLEEVVPGISERLSQRLMASARLPFVASHIEVLGFGSGATVLLLRSPSGQKVLKIYRRSLGRSSEGLMALAQEFRQKHTTISGWYGAPSYVVLPTHFLILHGPLLSQPAVAALQPYVEGEHRDLFTDFETDELFALLRNDPELAQQVLSFARQTIRLYSELRLAPDLLGHRNLAVVTQGNRRKLLLMDYGIFELGKLAQRSPATAARIEDRIACLRFMLDRSSTFTA
jgi:hypothetical protein